MRSNSNLTDQQLIQLFVNGDSSSLEDLIYRHKDRIFTSIVILLKDKSLAEDIFQEVFIKIIDTLRSGSYTDEGKFLPWVMRISHNLCIDYFRKQKRMPQVQNAGKDNDDFDIFRTLKITDDNVFFTQQEVMNLLVGVEKFNGVIPEPQYTSENGKIVIK
jgi:RNA polymerase sigma-70 factor (ECF subfamily)